MARRRGANGAGSAFGGAHEQVPVPKLTDSNSNLLRRPARMPTGRKPPGKVMLTIGMLSILICLAVAIGGFVSLANELPYRAGWAGTPGTVSLVLCRTVGSGKSKHTDCDGEFQADSQASPKFVGIEGDNTYSMLRAYPARLHSDGQTVSVVGGKTVAFILGGMFTVLAFIVGIGWLMVYGAIGVIMRRWVGWVWRPRRSVGAVPMMVAGVLLLFGLAGGIVGSVLSF